MSTVVGTSMAAASVALVAHIMLKRGMCNAIVQSTVAVKTGNYTALIVLQRFPPIAIRFHIYHLQPSSFEITVLHQPLV